MNRTTTDERNSRHDGMNVKRIREVLKVKQSTLASELGSDWNQKKISQLEDKEVIDDALMEEIADALNVPVEAIRNFDEESMMMNVQNNFEGSNNQGNNGVGKIFNINPVEKWMEAMEENKRLSEENKQLYERLLQAEKDKVKMMERLLGEKK